MEIRIEALRKRYANFMALHDVDLTIRSGELIALLGPSGSGKTTLLRALAGLVPVDGGRILFDRRDATALSLRERRVGFVFQHYALFKHLDVYENVAFGLRSRPRRERPPEAEISRRVMALLERVQLAELARRLPEQLSGGQRQRVALARAMAIDPTVLLLDEPFGALDAKVRVELRRWLRQIHDDTGYTTVFVTHSVGKPMPATSRSTVANSACRCRRAAASTGQPCSRYGRINCRSSPRSRACAAAFASNAPSPDAPPWTYNWTRRTCWSKSTSTPRSTLRHPAPCSACSPDPPPCSAASVPERYPVRTRSGPWPTRPPGSGLRGGVPAGG